MQTILVDIDGKSYEWDMDLTVAEDNVIHAATGLHYGQLMSAMANPDSDKFIAALQAIYWVLKKRAGEMTDVRKADFKINAFMDELNRAFDAAGLGEQTPPSESVPNAPEIPV